MERGVFDEACFVRWVLALPNTPTKAFPLAPFELLDFEDVRFLRFFVSSLPFGVIGRDGLSVVTM